MYAVIERYAVNPENAEEAVRRINAVLAGSLTHQVGFVEFDVVRAGEGSVMTICMFETRDQAKRVEQLEHAFERVVLGDLDLAHVWQAEGEVTMHRA